MHVVHDWFFVATLPIGFVSKLVGKLRRRVRFISTLLVVIEFLVSKSVGKLWSWVRSISILVVATELLLSKINGKVSELGPFYFDVGGCHRIDRVQING